VRIAANGAGDSFELVPDDGQGLPPGRESDLFRKFERGERESTTPGVGLGLALCSAIVEAHGGQITAENAPDGGARFVMRSPLGRPPVLPTAAELAQQGAA